uniref:Tissue factor pathway inhibitor n=1 Tax=Strix occidentalis caurina TaxID=311401 RepID=A0A8D0EWI0_STROC
ETTRFEKIFFFHLNFPVQTNLTVILFLLCITGAALPPLKLGHSVCAMKADEGPCKAIHLRYYFNIQSRECEMFEYGGCHGNENNFQTLEECQKKCLVTEKTVVHKGSTANPNFCFYEKDPGICRGYFSRYFYNKETKLCEVFKYGGCLGNQNNFKNLEECQTTCQGNCKLLSSLFLLLSLTLFFLVFLEQPHIPSLCMTPLDRGLCRAKELRFFYNYSTGRCRPFSYSGCGGNENNFTSRRSCLRICKKGFNKKKGERRVIKIKKKRKKQSVKALGEEVIPERIQL